MVDPSSRRDFFRGRSAADELADGGQAARDEAPTGSSREQSAAGSYVIRISRRAMACQFEVCFNAGQNQNDTGTALAALDVVEKLEDQLSVFRETSQLSRINRVAAEKPVEVEPGLFGLLELSLQLYHQTDRAFDITSAPLWKAWGFARRSGAIPTESEIADAMTRVGGHLLELDATRNSVRFVKPGVEINLGSIGKGYALDRAAEVIVSADIQDFLLHGGGSSVLARGTRLGSSTQQLPVGGWRVGLPHPLRRGARLGEIQLRDRALATSSSAFQYFRHKGKRYGHVLDPRTGWPAEGVLSATALAPSAAEADALATAFYVMGPEPVDEFVSNRPGLGAILVCPASRGPGIEVLQFGIEEGTLRPATDL